MAATQHATLTSSSPLRVPSPLWSAELPGRTSHSQTNPLTSVLPSSASQAPSPVQVPIPSEPGFLPLWLEGLGGGDSCVSEGCPLPAPPPSCLSPMTAVQSKGRGLSQPPPHAGIKCPPWLCSSVRTIQGRGGLWGQLNQAGCPAPRGIPSVQCVWTTRDCGPTWAAEGWGNPVSNFTSYLMPTLALLSSLLQPLIRKQSGWPHPIKLGNG